MFNRISILYTYLFCTILISSLSFGQEPELFLVHTPGDLNVAIFNTGAIGTEPVGGTGPGITWKGEQGLFMGGILFGADSLKGVPQAVPGAQGMFGSFTSGGMPVINDMATLASDFTSGFTSDANFNQISEAVIVDLNITVPSTLPYSQYTYSNTGDDFVFIRYKLNNNLGVDILRGYTGIGIDWDIGDWANNSGGYALDNSLVYQYDANDPNSAYFGIVALDDSLGGVRATPESAFPDVRLTIFDWMKTIDPIIMPNGDFRSYISTGGGNLSFQDSVWFTFAIVAGDNLQQITQNAIDASVKAFNLGWTSTIIPVELTSFIANVNNDGNVVLNWSTATEINNQMFEIERRNTEGQFTTIGYVEGYGTTTEPQEYSYIDNTVETGIYFYRLKQVDFSGQYEYSDVIEVEVIGPLTFALEQNYPNPFNPSTLIKYSVPENGFVKLSVYNLVGEEVSLLVNEEVDAGFYEVEFNAANLPSGTYFYRLQAGNTVQVKKMILLK